jgi:hypothetical protein
LSVDRELDGGAELFHIDKILLGIHGRKLLRHRLGVFGSYFVAHNRTDVSENRIFQIQIRLCQGIGLVQLRDVLMCDDESQTIFSRFGENGLDRIGDEVLEFVDVEEKILAFARRHRLALHRGDLDFRHQNQAEQTGIEVSEDSFRQGNQEDFFGIHNIRDVERGFRLTDDIAHQRIGDELPEFRGEIRDNLRFFTVSHLRERIIPPRLDNGVFERIAAFHLKMVVRKKTYQIGDRAAGRIVEEREAPVAKIILQTRSKYLVAEQFYHNIRRIGDHHLFFVVGLGFEEIDTHRTREVARVEVHEVFRAVLRDKIQKSARKIPMRIDDRESAMMA